MYLNKAAPVLLQALFCLTITWDVFESDETIVKNHPWVEDADAELKLLKKQEDAEKKELSDMFPKQEADPAEDGEGQGDE